MDDRETQDISYKLIDAADEFVEVWTKHRHALVHSVDTINPFYSKEVGDRVMSVESSNVLNAKIDYDIDRAQDDEYCNDTSNTFIDKILKFFYIRK